MFLLDINVIAELHVSDPRAERDAVIAATTPAQV